MQTTHREPRRSAGVLMLAFVTVTLLAVGQSAPWSIGSVLGQTIPWPTATPTPVATDTPVPTNTWVPRPTWTSVPTTAPQEPTITATPKEPQPTEPGQPTPAEPGQPTPSPSLTEPRPSLPPTPEPGSLVFEVLLQPWIAGPGDMVHFAVQVANVGRGPLQDILIEAVFPDALRLHAVDCDFGIADQGADSLSLTIGCLPSGDQVIATVSAEVVTDAWPGQALDTAWRATADDSPPQAMRTSLTLPWAELPATGWISDDPHTADPRGLHNSWQTLPM